MHRFQAVMHVGLFLESMVPSVVGFRGWQPSKSPKIYPRSASLLGATETELCDVQLMLGDVSAASYQARKPFAAAAVEVSEHRGS